MSRGRGDRTIRPVQGMMLNLVLEARHDPNGSRVDVVRVITCSFMSNPLVHVSITMIVLCFILNYQFCSISIAQNTLGPLWVTGEQPLCTEYLATSSGSLRWARRRREKTHVVELAALERCARARGAADAQKSGVVARFSGATPACISQHASSRAAVSFIGDMPILALDDRGKV